MANISYFIKKLKTADYSAMFKTIEKVHKATGKSYISIVFDIYDCLKKYGAGYADYELYEMYNMNDQQRDTVLTVKRNNDLVRKYCDKNYFHYFQRKNEFNETFNKYLKRDWLNVDTSEKQDVINFIKKHDNFFLKPNGGHGGFGVEKIDVKKFKDIEEVYNYIINKDCIIEETIIQKECMNKLYPYAINTARIVTILKDGVVHVIVAYGRIGNEGKVVDNFHSHGMTAPIDIETGIISSVGVDRAKNCFEIHPMTNVKIKGFQFPDWQQAIDMCKQAALVIPQMGYVGWDVAFSKKGPVFVEGNEFPGHDIYQLPAHTPDKIGVWGKFNI